ncbi:hypothetical protein [Alcanivorax sp. 1008]|uniref:hypothetical protein n=1 Tax=Alcanivorax sp. 1008 TaxID=2816853 RepID=UPI001D3152D2|nr:hypothetical protein [Alcanivorax sp. 1008]MCC1496852.1 hypothetical protein [Alcanivorax sp. 1008]
MDRHLRTATLDAALLESEDLSFLDRLVLASESEEDGSVLAGGDGIEYSVVLPETRGARRAALSAILRAGPTYSMERVFGRAIESDVDVVRFAPATPIPCIPDPSQSLDQTAPNSANP